MKPRTSLTAHARKLFSDRRLAAKWVLQCRRLRAMGKRIVDPGNTFHPGWINSEPPIYQVRFPRGMREAVEAGWK